MDLLLGPTEVSLLLRAQRRTGRHRMQDGQLSFCLSPEGPAEIYMADAREGSYTSALKMTDNTAYCSVFMEDVIFRPTVNGSFSVDEDAGLLLGRRCSCRLGCFVSCGLDPPRDK